MLTFTEFGLDDRLMDGISAMNYKQPTPVQQEVIPAILQGRDVIACAQTGTGKTAAFLLPILHQIVSQPQSGNIKAMVIVPTRELAIQIAQQIDGYGYFTPVSSLAVYGGGTGPDYANEQKALSTGVDVVVCTPGRMISHLNMGYVKASSLQFLVLDEADRMLDMGFHEDIMRIVSFLPEKRQSLLFSATMPPRIRELARRILHQPSEINIALSRPPEKIRQEAFVLYDNQKIEVVQWLASDPAYRSIIVFCDTKLAVKQLTRELKKTGKAVEEIHSDLEQSQREEVMNRFKSRQIRVLVATDIISRGIDVEDIDMIINYNVPHDAEDYVHRIGRTARAEADGRACTLIGALEQRKFDAIERLLGREVPKLAIPEAFGTQPDYKPSAQRPDKPFRRHAVRTDNRRKKSPERAQKESNKTGAGKRTKRRKPPQKTDKS